MDNTNEIVDILYREEFINKIISEINYVNHTNSNLFIMIDGTWGSGKTTILKMLGNKISGICNVIKYNCWENSFYSEPLIALISVVTEQLNDYKDINKTGLRLLESMSIITKSAIEKMLNGYGIKIIKKDKSSNKYKSIESYIKDFKKELTIFNETNPGISNKKIFVLIVDELDRCLPEYAIKVLERLYLIFKDIPNCVIVIGNNNIQLKSSIKRIFGNDICVEDYLKKFIDKTFTIDCKNINPSNLFDKYIDYFSLFDTDNENNIENCFKLISTIITMDNIRETEINIRQLIQKHKRLFGLEKYEMSICIYELLVHFVGVDLIKRIILKEEFNGINGDYNILQIELTNILELLENGNFNVCDYHDTSIKCIGIFLSIHYRSDDLRVIKYKKCIEYYKYYPLKDKLLLLE